MSLLLKSLRGGLVFAGLALVLAGCATTPSMPFLRGEPKLDSVPEAELRAVAEAIEQAVREGNKDAGITNQGPIVAEFPELQQAVRSRALRAPLINGFLDSGHAYETDNGLIAVIRTKEYKAEGNAQDRDRDALLVMSENNNRWTIYEGLVEKSNLPARALASVQEVFRQVRVQNLGAGQKYQEPGGEITAK